MLHSTHYNLNLAEGTDLVNPLTVDVPNYQAIDNAMFANEQAGVGTATELKSGTIHAITRTNTNRNVFRFKSTSVFLVGDTFTVDGGAVTALYSDGSTLKDRCFIIGSEVLCMLDGSQLTVLATYYPEAQNVPFDDSNVNYTAANVQKAIENASTATGTSYSAGVSTKDAIDSKANASRFVTTLLTYDSSTQRFKIPADTPLPPNRLTIVVRNFDTGSYISHDLYVLTCFNDEFLVTAILQGNAPGDGHRAVAQWFSN